MNWFQKLHYDTALVMQFFSRLPIRLPGYRSSNNLPQLNETIAAFPVAGFIIALPSALLYYFSAQLWSTPLAATLAIALGVLITGALHEDGLADCADGLGGSPDKIRAMEIMRDSSIGTYGGTALFFSFTIRILALASLPPALGALALLMAHTIARSAMVIAISTSTYVRSAGLGDMVREGATTQNIKLCVLTTTIIVLTITLFSGTTIGIIAPIFGCAAAWSLLQWLKARLGGYTGDGLGAMEQVTEITTLLILSGVWA